MKKFILLSVVVFAGSLTQAAVDYQVRCAPQFRAQGSELSVEVLYGTPVAVITYGNPSEREPVQTRRYETKKSSDVEAKELYYIGQGFELSVNEITFRGHLTADFADKKLDVDDLACDIQEFRR